MARRAQARDSLREPEGDGGGVSDGAEESVGATVVAHGDAAPIFDAAEYDLGAVVLAVERGVASVNAASSVRVNGALRCVDRSWLNVRQP